MSNYDKKETDRLLSIFNKQQATHEILPLLMAHPYAAQLASCEAERARLEGLLRQFVWDEDHPNG